MQPLTYTVAFSRKLVFISKFRKPIKRIQPKPKAEHDETEMVKEIYHNYVRKRRELEQEKEDS